MVHEKDAIALTSGKTMVETLKPSKYYWNLLKRKVMKDQASPLKPDIILKSDAEVDLSAWGVDGRILHTPGHTPGSVSILLENGEAIIMDLASSGIFLGGIAFHRRMKHPPFHDDRNMVKKSIDKVLSMNTKRFYLGHGNAVTRELLEHYRNNFL